MSQVNLLPLRVQCRREQAHVLRAWKYLGFATIGTLVLLSIVLQMDTQNLQRARDLSESNVAHLRTASQQTKHARRQATRFQYLVQTSEQIEQASLPLVLLQTIAECCNADRNLQINTLRMDELVTAAEKGKVTMPKKQILLNGLADSDVHVSVLVNRLNLSQVFSAVELISSQAQSDEASSRRNFQIRCQQ